MEQGGGGQQKYELEKTLSLSPLFENFWMCRLRENQRIAVCYVVTTLLHTAYEQLIMSIIFGGIGLNGNRLK